MPRLTHSHRSAIEARLIEQALSPARQDLKERIGDIAEDAFKHLVGRKGMELLKELPQIFTPEARRFTFNIGGKELTHNFGEPRRYPGRWDNGWGRGVKPTSGVEVDHAITKRYERWLVDDSALDEREQELRNKISSMLASHSNTETLKQTWPEIAAVVDATVPPPVAKLPVADLSGKVRELNKLLPLPPKVA